MYSAHMKVIAGLATAVLAGALRGVVVAALWGWFLVPLGVRPLTWIHGIGVSYLVTFLVFDPPGKEREAPGFLESMLVSVSMSATFLLFGWLAHLWMVG